MPNNITEEMYIELAQDFKERFEKLKEENQELKKLLFVCYSLFRINDEDEDEDFSEIGRSITSRFLDDYIFK